MASKDAFKILLSQSIAPVVCIECGNNAYCIRRSPLTNGGSGEQQMFECGHCHHVTIRTVGELEPSDEDIQELAEKIVGWRKRGGSEPDPTV